MNIGEYQKKVDQWIKKYGVRYFKETTNTILLMEEIGEFARLMARVYGEQSFKDEEKEQSAKSEIAQEMGDIVFVLTCLANQMNIDLEGSLIQNLEKKTLRDRNRHRKNRKLSQD